MGRTSNKRGAAACAVCVACGAIATVLGATQLEVYGVGALAFAVVAYVPAPRKR